MKNVAQREAAAVDITLDGLVLPKQTPLAKVQTVVYSVLGLHIGVFVMYALYVVFFLGRYQLGGYDFSLEKNWTNLPAVWHLPSGLSWIPLGGPGGLGQWIASNWDFIQHSYLLKIPVGIVGFVFIGLLLGKVSKRPLGDPSKMDKFLVRLGFANRHQGQLGKHEETSFRQYLFLLPAMLVASLPGIIGGSLLIFGGAALLHSQFHTGWLAHPSVWHPALLNAYLAGTTWQPIAVGFAGARFFGRKSVTKPALDLNRYFLSCRLWVVQEWVVIINQLANGEITPEAAMDKQTKLPGTHPSRLHAPAYRGMYEALESKVFNGLMKVPDRGSWSKYVIRAVVALLTFLAIYGAYMYLWFPKHGGWLL